jgi:hypothetical protein
MSRRTFLTYAERDHVLQQRALIGDDDVFVSCVKKRHPTISTAALGDKNLAIWSIAVNVAKRRNKMHVKSLSKHDYNNYDRAALAHYDPRYLLKQFSMTSDQVQALRDSIPKPVIDVRAPSANVVEPLDPPEIHEDQEEHEERRRSIAVDLGIFAAVFIALIYVFAA